MKLLYVWISIVLLSSLVYGQGLIVPDLGENCTGSLNCSDCDDRFIQIGDEEDPIWLSDKTDYFTKSQYWTNATSSFLTSYTETDPLWTANQSSYWKSDGSSTATGRWTLGSYNITALDFRTGNMILSDSALKNDFVDFAKPWLVGVILEAFGGDYGSIKFDGSNAYILTPGSLYFYDLMGNVFADFTTGGAMADFKTNSITTNSWIFGGMGISSNFIGDSDSITTIGLDEKVLYEASGEKMLNWSKDGQVSLIDNDLITTGNISGSRLVVKAQGENDWLEFQNSTGYTVGYIYKNTNSSNMVFQTNAGNFTFETAGGYGYIHAKDFITHTETFDGDAIALLEQVDEYFVLANGSYNYSAWGVCMRIGEINDLTKPIYINQTKEECKIERVCEDICEEVETFNGTKIYCKQNCTYPTTCEEINETILIGYEQKESQGVSLGCMDAVKTKAVNQYAEAVKPTETTEGVVLEGGTSIWDEIYTKSETIDKDINYLDLFVNKEALSSKATHKNLDTITTTKGEVKQVLNMEDRLMELEGAVADLVSENTKLKLEIEALKKAGVKP